MRKSVYTGVVRSAFRCYGGFVNTLVLNEVVGLGPTACHVDGTRTNVQANEVAGRSGRVLTANDKRARIVLRDTMPATSLVRRGPKFGCSLRNQGFQVRVLAPRPRTGSSSIGRAVVMQRPYINMPATSNRPEQSGGPKVTVFLHPRDGAHHAVQSGHRNSPTRCFRKSSPYQLGGPTWEPVIPGSNPGEGDLPRCIEDGRRAYPSSVVNAPGSPSTSPPNR